VGEIGVCPRCFEFSGTRFSCESRPVVFGEMDWGGATSGRTYPAFTGLLRRGGALGSRFASCIRACHLFLQSRQRTG